MRTRFDACRRADEAAERRKREPGQIRTDGVGGAISDAFTAWLPARKTYVFAASDLSGGLTSTLPPEQRSGSIERAALVARSLDPKLGDVGPL